MAKIACEIQPNAKIQYFFKLKIKRYFFLYAEKKNNFQFSTFNFQLKNGIFAFV